MTPKDKAKMLIEKFRIDSVNFWYMEQCALIAVDEILKREREWMEFCLNKSDLELDTTGQWEQVKEEIQKIINRKHESL
jgi:hypothetical protein